MFLSEIYETSNNREHVPECNSATVFPSLNPEINHSLEMSSTFSGYTAPDLRFGIADISKPCRCGKSGHVQLYSYDSAEANTKRFANQSNQWLMAELMIRRDSAASSLVCNNWLLKFVSVSGLVLLDLISNMVLDEVPRKFLLM